MAEPDGSAYCGLCPLRPESRHTSLRPALPLWVTCGSPRPRHERRLPDVQRTQFGLKRTSAPARAAHGARRRRIGCLSSARVRPRACTALSARPHAGNPRNARISEPRNITSRQERRCGALPDIVGTGHPRIPASTTRSAGHQDAGLAAWTGVSRGAAECPVLGVKRTEFAMRWTPACRQKRKFRLLMPISAYRPKRKLGARVV